MAAGRALSVRNKACAAVLAQFKIDLPQITGDDAETRLLSMVEAEETLRRDNDALADRSERFCAAPAQLLAEIQGTPIEPPPRV